jgi:hypothetical protein
MDSASSTKVSELFTRGSHHRNNGLVLMTQNLFQQGTSSRDISLNSKYIVLLKNPRYKTQFVHLPRHVYPEIISSFHKTHLEVCKDPYTYFFLDLTQSINDLLSFRTNIFPNEITEVFTPVKSNEPTEISATFPPRT